MKSPPGGALAWTTVTGALAGFAACLATWLSGGASLDVPWAPTLGLRLDLALDGLGALYVLLATGIGTVVFAYGAAYLPLHLEHERRAASEGRRFWPWMALFGADLDARRRPLRDPRRPVLMVLDIVGSALLLLGLLLATIGLYGLLRMPDIFHQLHPARLITGPAVILVLLACVATGSAEIITSAVLVILFVLITSPLSTHAIAQAARRRPRREQDQRAEPRGHQLPP